MEEPSPPIADKEVIDHEEIAVCLDALGELQSRSSGKPISTTRLSLGGGGYSRRGGVLKIREEVFTSGFVEGYRDAKRLFEVCGLTGEESPEELCEKLSEHRDHLRADPELRTVAGKVYHMVAAIDAGADINQASRLFLALDQGERSPELLIAALTTLIYNERKTWDFMEASVDEALVALEAMRKRAATQYPLLQIFSKDRIVLDGTDARSGLISKNLFPEDPFVTIVEFADRKNTPKKLRKIMIDITHESLHRQNLGEEGFKTPMGDVDILELITEYAAVRSLRDFSPVFQKLDEDHSFRVTVDLSLGFGYKLSAKIAHAIHKVVEQKGVSVDLVAFGVAQDVPGFRAAVDGMLGDSSFRLALSRQMVEDGITSQVDLSATKTEELVRGILG